MEVKDLDIVIGTADTKSKPTVEAFSWILCANIIEGKIFGTPSILDFLWSVSDFDFALQLWFLEFFDSVLIALALFETSPTQLEIYRSTV